MLVVGDRFEPIFGPGRGLGSGSARNEATASPKARAASDDRQSLMLDPSVFFRPRDQVLVAVEESVAAMDVDALFTPAAAITALESDDAAATIRTFGGAAAVRFEPAVVLETIRAAGVVPYVRPDSASEEFSETLERLRANESIEPLAEIQFDEWFYLTHNSTVVSRLKRPFRQIARAGALVIELTTPLRDRAVRKTLKLDGLEPVTRARTLRALGKWTAVGGDAALAFVAPWIAGPAALGVNAFLLLDP